jgi:hypothetical protein
MRLWPMLFILWLPAITESIAGSTQPSMPTLGFYITGETGADLLDTIIPELARVGFAESLPREVSTEHLPLATFRRSDGDEIRVTAGKQCALLAFYSAGVPPGTDRKKYGRAYAHRFSDVHATLKQYFARLPQPHPTILEGEIPPVGMCPSEF